MTRTLVKISESNHLVRDIESKAILNTDKAGLNDYILKRQVALKQQFEQNETKVRLCKLEQDMADIKSILLDIANMRKCNGD
jgi:hypothetical protein